MDATNRQLLRLLRDNARLSISSLAAALGVSRGTAQARLDRLLADGTILGFTIRQKPEAEAGQVRAVTLLEVSGGRMAPRGACPARPAGGQRRAHHERKLGFGGGLDRRQSGRI